MYRIFTAVAAACAMLSAVPAQNQSGLSSDTVLNMGLSIAF